MSKTRIYSAPIGMDVFEEHEYRKSNKTSKEQTELLGIYDTVVINNPMESDVVSVTFIGQSNEYLLFDGNFKDYLRVENKPHESKYLKNTKVGDLVDVTVMGVDQNNFMIMGSISYLYESKAHETLKSIEEGQSVSCVVKELTPAGYNVDIYYESITLPGFMPNTLAGINKLHNPESIVGQTLNVMIESYSKDEGTYIISRRKYLQSLIPQTIKSLNTGEVYKGHVTGTTEFGVFVEFNECLTGMIHKTNIDPDWQDKISQIQPGYEIEFYIKEIVKDKIILTQILRETMWDTIKIGQTLNGKIKDLKQFGVLVILDEETIGLIHNSEVEKSNKKFQAGDSVKVRIISIDRANRKIFLGVA